MIKDIVEPMFTAVLPSPLKSLRFAKVDFGAVPIEFSNVKVSKTEVDGIKLEMNMDWAVLYDMELKANMLPALGVKSVQLHGRLIVLLCPITNIIPLIGAMQLCFVNPPALKFNFTGAANIADFSMIDGAHVHPAKSLLVKLDFTADYFKTYHEPLGVLRVTVEKAWGFAREHNSKAGKLLAKVTRSAPDCYACVNVGAEPMWRTTTKSDQVSPVWDEAQDFVVSDFDQCVKIDIRDSDLNGDDDVGMAVTTIREIILGPSQVELPLYLKDEATDGRIVISCAFYGLEMNTSSFSDEEHSGPNRLCGIVNVLIAGVFGIKGQRHELRPSIVFTWGTKYRSQTMIKTDAPGMDINNPVFDQCFRMLGTQEMMDGTQNFRVALLNGELEIGASDIAFEEVHDAPDMTLDKTFDVGDGATVRARICVRGVGMPTIPQAIDMPVRAA